MMPKYLQVIWLYVAGIMIILIGLYLLILSPGPTAFIVMLVGLGISAMGAAHGRKMRMTGQLDIDDLMREKGMVPEGVEEVEGGEVVEEQKVTEEVEPEDNEEATEEVEEEGGSRVPNLGGIKGFFKRPQQEGPMEEDDIFNIEMEDIKRGKLAPTEADIIKFVCPKCSAENDEKNYFCFKCGNKLRRKPSKESKSEEPEIKVEPGAIEVIDNKRVAKVMICPKCNTANKVRDKFCWSCGKKIKPEHVKKIELPEK